MCRYLAEHPNQRNQDTIETIETIIKTIRGKTTTDTGFIELAAWHAFTFIPAMKKAASRKAAAAAKKAQGRKVYKRKPSKVELRPEARYEYHCHVHTSV